MAKNLMIQGTMSGAGKSILTAGILRVLRRRGLRAVPFKSQNMALNSFVTADGGEMGRAQAVQAMAAGVEPTVDMNPILLKPTGHASSQVIVRGRPIGTMPAAEYYRIKQSLVPEIRAAYERLAATADVVVIEGAGSPVEINLREGDFVNMGLAGMVDAPVLLVGNIDPGGVFAQLLGTISLMSPDERARVKGLIINKFRGDVSLLKPGLDMFREYCKIPFAGIVPYLPLSIDEEDSLSERLERQAGGAQQRGSDEEDSLSERLERQMGGVQQQKAVHGRGLEQNETSAEPGGMEAETAPLDIAVIRLPYMSNYTDFSALDHEHCVSLRYVRNASLLGRPDLIILPGTKNTAEDLCWLHETGFAGEIIRCAREHDIPVLGICGGFQILGQAVREVEREPEPSAELTRRDEPELSTECIRHEIEKHTCAPETEGVNLQTGKKTHTVDGLGLLPVVTWMHQDAEKVTRQREGCVLAQEGMWKSLNGAAVRGYEIHQGRTQFVDEDESLAHPFAELNSEDTGTKSGRSESEPDGAVCGNVLGTYLHGVFDEPEFRNAFLGTLFARKGAEVPILSAESAEGFQERQLDLLADVLEECLDWDLIEEVIGVTDSAPAEDADASADWHRRLQTIDPREIEQLSMQTIRKELAEAGKLTGAGEPTEAEPRKPGRAGEAAEAEAHAQEREARSEGNIRDKIVFRVIHATADFDYRDTMTFHPEAIRSIQEAIRRGARIVTDTNMARMGISKKSLSKYGGDVLCFMADTSVAEEAASRGVTRAAVSMERAAALPGETIFAIGNAPTALIRLRELIDSGYRPAGIIGVPVGFVNVVLSKELIMETDVPWIVNRGRKGGSGVAAAICNAILYGMEE